MTYREISLEKIRPSTTNPRMDYGDIEELAETMKDSMGVIEPITVRTLPEGDYEVIVGSRRVRASRLAGHKTIPAIIKKLNDDEVMRMQIVENLQRQDLSPAEEGKLFKNIQTRFGYSGATIAEMIGKDQSYVNERIRLLDLPEEVVTTVTITGGHGEATRPTTMTFTKARALIPLEKEKQIILARRITDRGMTAEQITSAIRKSKEVEAVILRVRRPELRERMQEKYLTPERIFDPQVKVQDVKKEIDIELGIPIGVTFKQQWEDTIKGFWAFRREQDAEQARSFIREWEVGRRKYVQLTLWQDYGVDIEMKESVLVREDFPVSRFADFNEADKYAQEHGGYCSGIIEMRGVKFWCIYLKEKENTES